jgi:hypothetical protein
MRRGDIMKIKAGAFGTIHGTESKKARTSAPNSEGTPTAPKDGVSLSEDGAFIQVLRQAAQGKEPLRSDLVEQAKQDLANNLLGSKEDYEQAINSLFLEL